MNYLRDTFAHLAFGGYVRQLGRGAGHCSLDGGGGQQHPGGDGGSVAARAAGTAYAALEWRKEQNYNPES